MLKKFFLAAFTLALILTQKVSAQEVWVYSDEAGYGYYVQTETFENHTKYRDNRAFDVIVTCRYLGDSPRNVKYSLWENDGIVWYKVEGFPDMRIADETEAAYIWEYGLKFLNLDYTVSYK